ncbi:apoptosis-inducing factor 3-like [Anneissia japonica]|uniref:apoptosis-inducing factor 3-like n=1 Tax=Anneissia japonica TaxID=1529436 RepID=UPI0014257FD5|nr:apoptosis-inducing factor 3-like [Anneissia japonica]XP_033123204.1 apoptosis-inducing factor 3-like [Anneissia japonica]XP_033123205.1 apoptosis-inducing factor 3-like [Anneissia japonica]
MGSSSSKNGSNGTPVDSSDAPTSRKSKGSPTGKGGVSKQVSDTPVEVAVCKVDDMKDGEMREVAVGSGKALLIREHGEFSAIGHKCSHYGAPLIKGVLCNGRVRCPWHGACFNSKTGDIEESPGLDSVPMFEVRVEGDDVIVCSKGKEFDSYKRIKSMSCQSPDEDNKILIIGGGAAAITCAEILRQEGFKGQLVMATKEGHVPYDRPKLSKALDTTADALALRKADFFSVYDIDVKTSMEAVSVDTMLNSVKFQNGESLVYDTLVVATGGKPRVLSIPGADLENVCLLRTPEDGNHIVNNARDKNVVIIGASFIGVEVAAYLANKASSVTVIGRSSVPYESSLGKTIGGALQKLCEEKNVKFIMNSAVSELKGEEGKLTEVVLKDGQILPADVCVAGIGVTPSTEFLKDSGVALNDWNAVVVDKTMKTNKQNIYAAGDIVEFPLSIANDAKVNIGHWQMAHAHGRTAALNILEQETEVNSVPYFWTQLFGKSLRFAGYSVGADDVIIDGNMEELKFVAYYTKGDCVVAAASMNCDPVVSQFAEFLMSGKDLLKSEIQSDPSCWKCKL